MILCDVPLDVHEFQTFFNEDGLWSYRRVYRQDILEWLGENFKYQPAFEVVSDLPNLTIIGLNVFFKTEEDALLFKLTWCH